eukprot:m.36740 g.36740  ORF g.36740 m.36740 type:complete len:133 (+) comp10112_c0_seq1:487-885(+)
MKPLLFSEGIPFSMIFFFMHFRIKLFCDKHNIQSCNGFSFLNRQDTKTHPSLLSTSPPLFSSIIPPSILSHQSPYLFIPQLVQNVEFLQLIFPVSKRHSLGIKETVRSATGGLCMCVYTWHSARLCKCKLTM